MFGASQMFGATQGGFGSSTQATAPDGTRKPRQEEKQTCLPVTIRTVEAALAQRSGGDDLKFFGIEPNTLIIVACVESVVRQSTGLEMTVNDSTGRMKARYFVTDPQAGQLEKIVPGSYISAFGNARAAPSVHLALNGVRVVESADEISYHIIECAHSALRLSQKPVETASAVEQKGFQPMSPVKTTVDTPVKPMSDTPSFPTPSAPAATPEVADLPMTSQAPASAEPLKAPAALHGAGLRAAVLAALRADDVDPGEGLGVEAFSSKFAPTTKETIKECLASLVGDGEIYSTVDDDHFAAV